MKLKYLFVLTTVIITICNCLFNNRKNNHSEIDCLMLQNIEALANCESSVEHKKGRTVFLSCTNSNGEVYVMAACDFNSGYSTDCKGPAVN